MNKGIKPMYKKHYSFAFKKKRIPVYRYTGKHFGFYAYTLSAALTIISATILGCDMKITWLPLTSSTIVFERLYISL
ncbi:hypothetical protein SAMN04488101_101325 [Pedobacter nyackensis]|uniref:Uncharacterized protein n=1 Tax=Pedobacter nyackensis TaxID=475255 RepID=A0A1W2A8X3_9SPHI|nr:hypothetical protein SAMN04488101_101325 [Pedobacter nyackensis]